MTKEFIPYEEALALNELGYRDYSNFEVTAFYQKVESHKLEYMKFLKSNPIFISQGVWLRGTVGEEPGITEVGFKEEHLDCVLAPLYQQAFRWFRNKYKKQAEILWAGDMDYFVYKIGNFKYADYIFSDREFKAYFETYEDAELACLRKLIELVKKEV